MPCLILGTGNRKKAREMAALLDAARFDIELRTLADVSHPIEVVEDGDSFAENAAKKAIQQAQHLGCWVLAEDSGLVVDALDGAPGIRSARFSGPDATDATNNRLLLERLVEIPPTKRTAHYCCQMTLADSAGAIRAESMGRCHGRIALTPAGTSGFGYDPLFDILEYHRTFGQLGEVVKSILSHRARASAGLIQQLPALLAEM